MARGIWARLAAMPPVDFVALAERERDANRRPKKGDRCPRADVEKSVAARKERRAERRKAVSEQIRQRLRRRKQSCLTERAVLAMEPGEWYARFDIAHLADVSAVSLKTVLARLLRDGLVTRQLDPDYVSPCRDIQYLWCLTPTGEAKRTQWAYLA